MAEIKESAFEQCFTGRLGSSVGCYQKTVKRKAGRMPWIAETVSSSGELYFSFSYDGTIFGREISTGSVALARYGNVARAVKVRVRKSCKLVSYRIVCEG